MTATNPGNPNNSTNPKNSGNPRNQTASWNSARIRALRNKLGLSQRQMADMLGTRQQTISEWETGMYQPRGASARLLGMVAEKAGFEYRAGSD